MDLNQLSQNPEQIKQLISLLQGLLPSDKQNDESNEEPLTKKEITNTFPNKNSQSDRKHHNKFISMPEMNMHKEDTELDKKLAKHAPVVRAREYDPVRVMCRVCGKTETISPSLVDSAGRYKCNKCSSSAG